MGQRGWLFQTDEGRARRKVRSATCTRSTSPPERGRSDGRAHQRRQARVENHPYVSRLVAVAERIVFPATALSDDTDDVTAGSLDEVRHQADMPGAGSLPLGLLRWIAGAGARAEPQAAEDTLVEEIHEIHAEHRGKYGVLCIHAELSGFGHTVNRKRGARLMVQRCSCPCRWSTRPPYLSNSDDLIMVRRYVDMNSQTGNGSYWVPIYPGP